MRPSSSHRKYELETTTGISKRRQEFEQSHSKSQPSPTISPTTPHPPTGPFASSTASRSPPTGRKDSPPSGDSKSPTNPDEPTHLSDRKAGGGLSRLSKAHSEELYDVASAEMQTERIKDAKKTESQKETGTGKSEDHSLQIERIIKEENIEISKLQRKYSELGKLLPGTPAGGRGDPPKQKKIVVENGVISQSCIK